MEGINLSSSKKKKKRKPKNKSEMTYFLNILLILVI